MLTTSPDVFEFDPRFVRACPFATLHTPGYGTRVTLCNGVLDGHEFATPLHVSMSAFDQSGGYLGTSDPFLVLEPGQIDKVEVDEVLRGMVSPGGPELRDVLGILHLVPERWLAESRVQVTRKELVAQLSATDDFVEFFSYRGHVVTGVAYQTGPMNDTRLSSTCTTTIQAPKVITSENVDTLFLLMNVSTGLEYSGEVNLRFKILDRMGRLVLEDSVLVPAWSFRLLSCRALLEAAGAMDAFREAGGLGTLYGMATDGSLVPLSMTRNDHTGAIAVDHTLPPPYYVNRWGGPLRKRSNELLGQTLFAETRTLVSA